MGGLMRFFKTTVLGGAVFLLPVTVVVYLVARAFVTLHGMLDPVHRQFPQTQFLGVGNATLLTLGVLLALCFAAGLAARSMAAKGFQRWIEEHLLVRIPGYSMLRSMAHGALGQADGADLKPALVRTGEAWQLGFVAESLPDGRQVVFVPEAPEALSGDVLVVDAAVVRPLDVALPAALRCLRTHGRGLAALAAGATPGPKAGPADPSSA
jgi:uncharacterized membrane protein